MKKDFNDFKKTIPNEKSTAISNEIINKLNNSDVELNVVEYQRSYNAMFTMKLLEEYHNWLNN